MKIEVYTKPNCPECVKVKGFLKTEGYEFEEKELNSDNIVEFMKYTRSAPVVLVDGEFYSNQDVLNETFSRPTDLDLEFEM